MVVVEDNLVIQSAPILSWTVGRQWPYFRDYCEKKGWTIEPLVDDMHVHVEWIDTEEASYEFHWVGNRCLRITKHVEGQNPEDVSASELPSEITELII